LHSRVEDTWQELSNPDMKWLRGLPEWEKINQFKDRFSTVVERRLLQSMADVIEGLEKALTAYIRGAIIHCLYNSLSDTQVSTANYHRRLQYDVRPYLANFKTIYDSFSIQERTITRFFWQTLSKIPVFTVNSSNWERFRGNNPFIGRSEWICELHDIQNIRTSTLERHIGWFNDATENATHQLGVISILSEFENEKETLEKFSLVKFFDQARGHIQSVCQTMLNRGEMDWATTTDTLLCLSDKEWTCLPNWEEREMVIGEPEKDEGTKEKSELTDTSDWDGADDGSMSEWDLVDD